MFWAKWGTSFRCNSLWKRKGRPLFTCFTWTYCNRSPEVTSIFNWWEKIMANFSRTTDLNYLTGISSKSLKISMMTFSHWFLASQYPSKTWRKNYFYLAICLKVTTMILAALKGFYTKQKHVFLYLPVGHCVSFIMKITANENDINDILQTFR